MVSRSIHAENAPLDAHLSEPITLRKPRISLYKTPFVGNPTVSVNESDGPKSGMCNRNRHNELSAGMFHSVVFSDLNYFPSTDSAFRQVGTHPANGWNCDT